MQKREKVLGACVLAAGAFFVFNQFICAEEQAAELSNPTIEPTVAQDEIQPDPIISGDRLTNSELKKRLQNWQPLVTYQTWGRNPFEGALKLEKTDSSADSLTFKLFGIVEKGADKIALIDDYIVQSGDRTGDFEVVQVRADHVIVRYGGKLVKLFLDKEKASAIVAPGK